jgi:nicotinamidase-related amidase
MKALIIVDMLKDFVDGELANPRAQRIAAPLRRLLDHARESGWVVVFSNDAHRPDDPELKIWGEHAMEGSPGAQVIDELAPRDGDLVSPKRSYGAFDATGLAEELKERNVDEVVITGQHTHICVRHSSYGALRNGFEVTVPRDAVCAFEGVNEEDALEYLKMAYGANVTTVDELVETRVPATA